MSRRAAAKNRDEWGMRQVFFAAGSNLWSGELAVITGRVLLRWGRILAGMVLGLLGLLSLGGLVGCSTEAPMVHIFVYNMEDPYISRLSNQTSELVGRNYRVKMHDALNSQAIQNQQIEQAMEEGSKLLVVNPVDRLSSYAIINKAKEAGIPIIFYNREPLIADLELWDQTYYVGARAIQSANLQVELISRLFGENPKALNQFDKNADNRIQTIIIKGEQGHQDAEIRTFGALATFEELGYQVDILALQVANWNRGEAYDGSQEILSNFRNEVELVLSNNDAMALGIIARMREMDMFADDNMDGVISPEDSSWIPVVGIDGIEDALEEIQRGYLYGTVINDSMAMAQAIDELTGIILGGKSRDELSMPLDRGIYIWIDYQPFIQ